MNGFGHVTPRSLDDDDEMYDDRSQLTLESVVNDMEAAFSEKVGKRQSLCVRGATLMQNPSELDDADNSEADDELEQRRSLPASKYSVLSSALVPAINLFVSGTSCSPQPPAEDAEEEVFASHGVQVEPMIVDCTSMTPGNASAFASGGGRRHTEVWVARHVGLPPREPSLAVTQHAREQLLARLWVSPIAQLLDIIPVLTARSLLSCLPRASQRDSCQHAELHRPVTPSRARKPRASPAPALAPPPVAYTSAPSSADPTRGAVDGPPPAHQPRQESASVIEQAGSHTAPPPMSSGPQRASRCPPSGRAPTTASRATSASDSDSLRAPAGSCAGPAPAAAAPGGAPRPACTASAASARAAVRLPSISARGGRGRGAAR